MIEPGCLTKSPDTDRHYVIQYKHPSPVNNPQESYMYDHDGRSVHEFLLRSHFEQIIPVRMISIREENIIHNIEEEYDGAQLSNPRGYSHFFFIRMLGSSIFRSPPPLPPPPKK